LRLSERYDSKDSGDQAGNDRREQADKPESHVPLHRIEASRRFTLHRIEFVIDPLESLVDLFEPCIDLVQPPFNLIKAPSHLHPEFAKVSIDAVEALVEPLVGPPLPCHHRHDGSLRGLLSTVACGTKILREIFRAKS
jgi:hypothetical protein